MSNKIYMLIVDGALVKFRLALAQARRYKSRTEFSTKDFYYGHRAYLFHY